MSTVPKVWLVKRWIVAVLSVGVTAAGLAAAANAGPGVATLNNEQLGGASAAFDYHVTSSNCNPAGTSTFSFSATGPALGPYPGTFTETGTVTIGPETNPPQFDANFPTGPIVQLDATFTIDSVNGTTINGGSQGEVPGFFTFGVCETENDVPPSAAASCAGNTNVLEATIERIAGMPFYTATISTAGGNFTDSGQTFLGFVQEQASCPNEPDQLGAAINHQFSSSLAEAPPVDQTPPVVTFNGNQGSYGLLDTVHITCTTSDPAPSSGIATDPCIGFAIDGPAWSFNPGVNTLPNPGLVATDQASNSSAPATTSFSVGVTPSSLCALTTQFVDGSSKYQQLKPLQQKVVGLLTTAACKLITAIVPQLKPAQKALFVAGYKQLVQSLANDGWLTASQAATLTKFANAL